MPNDAEGVNPNVTNVPTGGAVDYRIPAFTGRIGAGTTVGSDFFALNPPTGSTSTLYDTGAEHTDVGAKYGVVFDGKLDFANITSGQAAVHTANAQFVSTDVGKPFKIVGAGAAGADLLTTILSFQGTNDVTLVASASTTVAGKFCAWGTDNTTAVNNWLADSANWTKAFIRGGVCIINGTITWPAFSAKVIETQGVGDLGTVPYTANGAVFLQLADAIPCVKTSGAGGTRNVIDGLAFIYFTPQTNSAGVVWLWSGSANASWRFWEIRHLELSSGYSAMAIDQVPTSITVWAMEVGIFIARWTKHRALDLNPSPIQGNPAWHIRFFGIFNTGTPQGQAAVTNDDVAVNTQSVEIAVDFLDLEGWNNRAWFSGSVPVHIRAAHIESHVINTTGVLVFEVATSTGKFDNFQWLISTTAGVTNQSCYLFRASSGSRVDLGPQHFNATLQSSGRLALISAQDATTDEIYIRGPIKDANAGGANAITVPEYSFNSNTQAVSRIDKPRGYGLKTAQTAAVASVVARTSPNDGQKHMYRISGFVTITTLGSGNINLEVTYTDSGGSARTCIIPLCAQAGTFATSATTADSYKGNVEIDVNPNTLITILTAGTFTGCTYNVGGAIDPVDGG